MLVLVGLAMLGSGIGLTYLLRPRGDQVVVPILAYPGMEASAAIIISALLLLGLGVTLSGAISLFGM